MRKITRKSTKLSYTVGTFFAQGESDLYILAQTGRGEHKLISIHGGNRYTDDAMTDADIKRYGFKPVEVEVN